MYLQNLIFDLFCNKCVHISIPPHHHLRSISKFKVKIIHRYDLCFRICLQQKDNVLKACNGEQNELLQVLQ